MDRILFCISHIYSQVRYRWPGIPEFKCPEVEDVKCLMPGNTDIHSLSLNDWTEILYGLREHFPEVLPWLGSWFRELDLDGKRLSTAIVQHLRHSRQAGAHYITFDQNAFPKLLRFIPDPPLAVTVTGDLSGFAKPCVSIIGSRKASAFAQQESFNLARLLGSKGFQIVSGGAFGCDIAAHQGALAAQTAPAPTVSVAAGGLSRLYPVHNQRVFDSIREQGGAFLSERLWWEGCRPRDFAARNRIISGMSFATCVMQAGMKSGALLTARHSLNHGREVLVLRHPEHDVRADGSRWLQDDGAEAFSSAEELAWRLAGPAV